MSRLLAGRTGNALGAQRLVATRLSSEAAASDSLARRIHRSFGLHTKRFAAPKNHVAISLPGFEVPMLLAEMYTRQWAPAFANGTLEKSAFQRSVARVLNLVSKGKAPDVGAPWSLREFIAETETGPVRPSAIEAARVMLEKNGPQRVVNLFERLSRDATVNRTQRVTRVAPPVTRETANAAVSKLGQRLAQYPTASMTVQPFTKRDRAALIDFALGTKNVALLHDTASWFKNQAQPWPQKEDDHDGYAAAWRSMKVIGWATAHFVAEIEPKLAPLVLLSPQPRFEMNLLTSGGGSVYPGKTGRRQWHTDSYREADLPYYARVTVTPHHDGTLAFIDGRLKQGGPGSLMVLWGEPTRHLGLSHRQPALHTTPRTRVSAIRTLGTAEIFGHAAGGKLVPQSEWGR